VFAIFALVIAGFAIGRNPDAISLNFANMFSTAPKGFGLVTSIGAAMVGSLFAMDAWAYVCSTAVEVENPRRNIPRALLYGTGFVALLYIVVNIAYMHVLPLMGNPDSADLFSRGIAYASEDRVATAIAQSMLGSAGLYVIAVAIMISTFGCVNGNILMNARLFYAMARDGLFFKSVGRVSTKTHVPTMALITSGIWSASLTLTGSYSQLLDYVIFATLIFYGMTIIALFVLRKKMPDMKRPYRAWGYPWLQILYIALASLIAVDLLVYKPAYTWPGLIIVISGVPVYYIWRLLSKGPVAELMPELEDAE
jgi:APA family basic amino acid/polyamine antiporter